MTQLNYKSFLISSWYLETIEDYISLVFVGTRLKYFLYYYRFNPISVNKDTVKWFPRTETLHIYNDEDYDKDFIMRVLIFRFVDWRKKITF